MVSCPTKSYCFKVHLGRHHRRLQHGECSYTVSASGKGRLGRKFADGSKAERRWLPVQARLQKRDSPNTNSNVSSSHQQMWPALLISSPKWATNHSEAVILADLKWLRGSSEKDWLDWQPHLDFVQLIVGGPVDPQPAARDQIHSN